MKTNKHSGRQAISRNRMAGDHLRSALKMLGKKWRWDIRDTNHVLNWDNWIANGLPRRPTTIDKDLCEGIPENRIVDYAHCLGILPEVLLSPQTDMGEVLTGVLSLNEEMTPTLVPGYRAALPTMSPSCSHTAWKCCPCRRG